MRQVNVSLPDNLRAELDAASAAAGHTLGTEIRNRLQGSISFERLGVENEGFMQLIGLLGFLTRKQTGHMWHKHAAAHFVFRRAIEMLLGRMKPAGDVVPFDELPTDRPVAVTDLEAMAAGLEAIISHGRMLQEGEQLLLREWEEERRQQLDQFKKIFETPPPAPRSHMRKPKPEGGHE